MLSIPKVLAGSLAPFVAVAGRSGSRLRPVGALAGARRGPEGGKEARLGGTERLAPPLAWSCWQA